MQPKRWASFALVLATLVTLVTIPLAADAHRQAEYYTLTWQRDLEVDFHFTDGFPGGDHRKRVQDAFRTWNGLNQPMFFLQLGDVPNFDPTPCPANYQMNGVHWRPDDGEGGTLAFVRPCIFVGSNELYSTQMVFDRDEDWYTGTGDANDGFLNLCIGGCQSDLWSVATHEVGHMTGFVGGPNGDGHFDQNDPEGTCTGEVHTMCPSYEGGSEHFRTLEVHDRHTFTAAY